MLPYGYHRHLIDASSLVGTHKLGNGIGNRFPGVVMFELHQVGADADHSTRFFSKHAYAGVYARLVFHTGPYDGGFGLEQRHSLPLHVGTH